MQIVKGNKVVLFMKGTPQQPMCGFSGQVVRILNHHGAYCHHAQVSSAAPRALSSEALCAPDTVYSSWYPLRVESVVTAAAESWQFCSCL